MLTAAFGPTLFIMASKTWRCCRSTVRDSRRFVDAPYRELRIPDSGHWVRDEAIEEVNNATTEFLGE